MYSRIARTEIPSNTVDIVIIELEWDGSNYRLTVRRNETKGGHALIDSDRELMVSRYLKTVRWATVFRDAGVL